MVTYAQVMAGLRERRHLETKQALLDAAFELFAARGFAAVTMDEIATAAGVSRSTAYRRFATKEDLVLEVPKRWLAAFDDAIEALPADIDLAGALRSGCMAVAEFIDADKATVFAAYRVLEEAPALRSTGVATSAWLERLTGLVGRFGRFDHRETGIDDELAGMIGGAYLGAIDAMMISWAAGGGRSSVAASTNRLLDRLAGILP